MNRKTRLIHRLTEAILLQLHEQSQPILPKLVTGPESDKPHSKPLPAVFERQRGSLAMLFDEEMYPLEDPSQWVEIARALAKAFFEDSGLPAVEKQRAISIVNKQPNVANVLNNVNQNIVKHLKLETQAQAADSPEELVPVAPSEEVDPKMYELPKTIVSKLEKPYRHGLPPALDKVSENIKIFYDKATYERVIPVEDRLTIAKNLAEEIYRQSDLPEEVKDSYVNIIHKAKALRQVVNHMTQTITKRTLYTAQINPIYREIGTFSKLGVPTPELKPVLNPATYEGLDAEESFERAKNIFLVAIATSDLGNKLTPEEKNDLLRQINAEKKPTEKSLLFQTIEGWLENLYNKVDKTGSRTVNYVVDPVSGKKAVDQPGDIGKLIPQLMNSKTYEGLTAEEGFEKALEIFKKELKNPKSKLFANLDENERATIEREISRQVPQKGYAQIIKLVNRWREDISNPRLELHRLFETDYTPYSKERGFEIARDLFLKILRTSRVPQEVKDQAEEALTKSNVIKDPGTVLNLATLVIRETELTADAISRGTNITQLLAEPIHAETYLTETPSLEGEVLTLAKNKIQAYVDKISGINGRIVSKTLSSKITGSIKNANDLSELDGILEGLKTTSKYSLKDVEDYLTAELITAINWYLDTKIKKENVRTTVRSVLRNVNKFKSKTESVTSLEEFDRVLEVFSIPKTVKGISYGTIAKSFSYVIAEKVKEVNRYIKGRNKSKSWDTFNYLTSGVLQDGFSRIEEYLRELQLNMSELGPENIYEDTLQKLKDFIRVINADEERYEESALRSIIEPILTIDGLYDEAVSLFSESGEVETSVSYKNLSIFMAEIAKDALEDIIKVQKYQTDMENELISQVKKAYNFKQVQELLPRLFSEYDLTPVQEVNRVRNDVVERLKKSIMSAILKQGISPQMYRDIYGPELAKITDLSQLQDFVNILTGQVRTGLQHILYAPGGLNAAKKAFADIIKSSTKTTLGKKRMLDILYLNTEDRPALNTLRQVRNYAVSYQLKGEDLGLNQR